MQYDEPSTHRPFAPQSPEQQSLLDVHVLLAVVHDAPVTIGWQVPPVQLPVQHAFPATGHAAPIVKHCTPPHVPETHEPLQQSVLPTHAAPCGAQVPIDEAQVPAGLQMPEQHELPEVHVPPNAVQLTLTAPSGAKLTVLSASPPDEDESSVAAPSPVDPVDPSARSTVAFDPSVPHPPTTAISAARPHP
jgi:hypothetical protein